MNHWFRSWHGAPTDPKWGVIGRKCDLAPGMVFAIAWSLFDRASQAAHRGSIEGYDPDEVAYVQGCDAEDVEAVIASMRERGMIDGDQVTAWEKRQPQREDPSTQRVREHRERKRQQRNAGETQCNAPEEDTDTDKNSPQGEVKRASARKTFPQKQFDEFWAVYPRKENKGSAEKAFPKALNLVPLSTLITGAKHLAASGTDKEFMPHPASWLNGKRWLDEPSPQSTGPPQVMSELDRALYGETPTIEATANDR